MPAIPSQVPPAHAEVVAELVIDAVEEIRGLTFAGSRIWIAASPRRDLVCIDPESGKVVGALGRGDCDSGTASDGQSIWQICGDRILRIDAASHRVLNVLPVPDVEPIGMTFARKHLWVSCGSRITEVDPITGHALRTIESDRRITGVTWVDRELWHAVEPQRADEPAELRNVDPADGRVKRRLTFPRGVRIRGIEWDRADRIWVGVLGAKPKLQAVRRP